MLQHADIHTKCFCYQKGDKQTISLKKVRRGETGPSLLTSHLIIFVISGAAKYMITGYPDAAVTLGPDEFIFMPASTNLVWEALEDTTVMLVRLSHLTGNLPECNTFRFQRLSGNLDAGTIGDRGIYPLKMNERIRSFIEDILVTERDGLKCKNYARHLVAILLTRIQVYYPQEEYMRFYSTVAGSDVVFTDQVYERWRECRSVKELANIFGMNVKRFTQHFTGVFGETPGSWLGKRRSELIYHDICSSRKSLREIAGEHGFLMTNFVRYCRMNFDNTPEAIRRGLTVDRTGSAAPDADPPADEDALA